MPRASLPEAEPLTPELVRYVQNLQMRQLRALSRLIGDVGRTRLQGVPGLQGRASEMGLSLDTLRNMPPHVARRLDELAEAPAAEAPTEPSTKPTEEPLTRTTTFLTAEGRELRRLAIAYTSSGGAPTQHVIDSLMQHCEPEWAREVVARMLAAGTLVERNRTLYWSGVPEEEMGLSALDWILADSD